MSHSNFVSAAPCARRLGSVLGALALVVAASVSAEPQVIVLTQVGCQFLESEKNVDHTFQTKKKADCEAINKETGEERLANSEVISLDPGKYIFRVTNKNVPYGLGFWLRGDGLINRAKLPSVSGGGLTIGKSRDYAIDLEPGEYVYSCPLNPTPDYRLVVNG